MSRRRFRSVVAKSPGLLMDRDEWIARLDRAEHLMVNRLLDRLEAYRIFRGRSVGDIAARARMSRRMYSYIRSRKGHMTIRQLIALCDAHGLEFTLPTRLKNPKPAVPVDAEEQAVNTLPIFDGGESENATFMEGSDVQ